MKEEAEVEALFWEWYTSVFYELWLEEDKIRFNDRAQRRAAILGIKFTLKRPDADAEAEHHLKVRR